MFNCMVCCSYSILAHVIDTIFKVNEVEGEIDPLCGSQDEVKDGGLELGAIRCEGGKWLRRVRGEEVWHVLHLHPYSHHKTYIMGHFLLIPHSS
jgi:hypothetical protein